MKFYIETLGCLKNQEDSEVAAGILEHSGHEMVKAPEDADLIMVNTCGFINDAKKESIQTIFDMAGYKENGDTILMVSGCLSQRYQKQLYREMPEVDIFLGVNEYENLPTILENLSGGKRSQYFSDYNGAYRERPFRKSLGVSYSATLKIAEGCDNRCTYCVIPSIRGGYRSRKMEDIVEEATNLGAAGCKELILIAQDVTAYGLDLYGELALPKLLRQLCKIDSIQWIRLMYCYEDRITDSLIEVMAAEEKICNYIDIPIQHSADKILTAMNRRSSTASIYDTIERLRTAIPDIHIRTTLITGFPGETQEDFLELLDFVETVKFERLGAFAYSKEEGTPASKMKGQVRETTKEKRREILLSTQMEISLASNREKIGKVLEVLVEGTEEQDNGGVAYVGRTRYDAPEIDHSVIFSKIGNTNIDEIIKIGDMVKVEIVDAFDYDLVGVMK